jgi:hypothetical protein
MQPRQHNFLTCESVCSHVSEIFSLIQYQIANPLCSKRGGSRRTETPLKEIRAIAVRRRRREIGQRTHPTCAERSGAPCMELDLSRGWCPAPIDRHDAACPGFRVRDACRAHRDRATRRSGYSGGQDAAGYREWGQEPGNQKRCYTHHPGGKGTLADARAHCATVQRRYRR